MLSQSTHHTMTPNHSGNHTKLCSFRPRQKIPAAFVTPSLPHKTFRRTTRHVTGHARRLMTARLTRSNIPMTLTWARMAAIPILCLTHLPPPLPAYPTASAALFAAASFTDFLDGYLARRWKVESELGAFLDPVADKLMVAVALALIIVRFPAVQPWGIITPISVAVILAREIFVSALREWMALRGKSASVKVGIWGKVKTAVQMIAVTVLLYSVDITSPLTVIGVSALVLSAVLSLVSAMQYTASAIRTLARVEP